MAKKSRKDPDPTSLEPYIQKVVFKVTHKKNTPIFTSSPAFPPPKLRKDIHNTILLFPGSFNPPHMGHKLLLTHAFFRSDLKNVVAAFIVPNADEAIRDKYQFEENALILSTEERTKLWGEEGLTPWSWVMSFTGNDRRKFESCLFFDAWKYGYWLEFAVVFGADHFDYGGERLSSDLDNVVEPYIVSCDGLRPVERDEDGAPKYLMTGYSNWKQSKTANERLLKTLRKGEHSVFAVLQLLYPQKAKMVDKKVSPMLKERRARAALNKCLDLSGDAWTCFWLKAPRLQYHFLPLPIEAVGGDGSELSATRIREIIRNHEDCSAGRLGKALANITLSPKLLAEMVKKHEGKPKKKVKGWLGQKPKKE